MIFNMFGWGGWIRTNECSSQSAVPSRLATPQYLIMVGRLRFELR